MCRSGCVEATIRQSFYSCMVERSVKDHADVETHQNIRRVGEPGLGKNLHMSYGLRQAGSFLLRRIPVLSIGILHRAAISSVMVSLNNKGHSLGLLHSTEINKDPSY
jgi:hypothetical protein